MTASIFLRNAIDQDSEMLLRWRNDPETRSNSLNTDEISPEDHERWFSHILQYAPQSLLIADVDEVSVGSIRMDWNEDGDCCHLSFSVAPEHRGKGYGFAMVERVVGKIEDATVTAEVKMANERSRRIFDRLGFRIVDSQGEFLLYSKACFSTEFASNSER